MLTLLRLIFLPAKVGYRTGRVVGVRRLFVFGVGLAVGLLLAPMAGRELRARLQELAESRRGTGDLATKVRLDLAQSPRTWHLPQPDVEVVGSTAILRGEVPHESGRADLERTAAAVPGVVSVDNQVVISGTNGHA